MLIRIGIFWVIFRKYTFYFVTPVNILLIYTIIASRSMCLYSTNWLFTGKLNLREFQLNLQILLNCVSIMFYMYKMFDDWANHITKFEYCNCHMTIPTTSDCLKSSSYNWYKQGHTLILMAFCLLPRLLSVHYGFGSFLKENYHF